MRHFLYLLFMICNCRYTRNNGGKINIALAVRPDNHDKRFLSIIPKVDNSPSPWDEARDCSAEQRTALVGRPICAQLPTHDRPLL